MMTIVRRRTLLLLAASAWGCCGAHADSVTKTSNNGENAVTISVTPSFTYKEVLWVTDAPYTDSANPPTQYTVNVTPNPGKGWKVSDPKPPASVMMNYGGSGLQQVITVNFEKPHKLVNGQVDYTETDTATASVFVYGVKITLRYNHGDYLTPQTNSSGSTEYDKSDYVSGPTQIGTNALGVIATTIPYNAGAAIEIDGVVSPTNLGVTAGGLNIPFIPKRHVQEQDYKKQDNNNSEPLNAKNQPDDSSSNVYDGTPSPTSKVYDADAPRINLSMPQYKFYPAGTVYSARWNMRQWFELNKIRCSNVVQWYEERTIIKNPDGTWSDYVTRNSIGAGQTSLTP